MVVSDLKGQLFEHPTLGMVGASGIHPKVPRREELSKLPEGSKFFTIPNSHPGGIDQKNNKVTIIEKSNWTKESFSIQAASTFPAPGWMRTLLPFSKKTKSTDTLPLWAYTAIGFDQDKEEFVCAAIQVDDCARWDPFNFDDSNLKVEISKMKKKFPKNRMIPHLAYCASESHCFAAKNFFHQRWEFGIPIAPLCNADCRGCISLQTDDLFPASHDRIQFVPTPEEITEITVPHLKKAEYSMVSFGQGCEGEPLLQAGIIERSCQMIRNETDKGTLHLNTNGSNTKAIKKLAEAGLESIRISTNSFIKEWHKAYYRPEDYNITTIHDSLCAASDSGLYTQVNYLVFPGITDLEAEVEALIKTCVSTQVHVIQMKNLCIDPDLYVKTLPNIDKKGESVGMKKLLDIIKEELPDVAIKYYNRPKNEWHIDPKK